MDPPLRGPLLDSSGGSNFGSVQLQLPQAHHQQPFERTPLAFLEDRTGPVREHGTLLAQARGAGPTVEALQAVVAPCAWLDRSAATAWTRDAIGPAHLSQVISSFLVILQVRDQVFHRVALRECEQPHYTDTACSCYNALLPMSVARIDDVDRRSVSSWLDRWQTRGFVGFYDQPGAGR